LLDKKKIKKQIQYNFDNLEKTILAISKYTLQKNETHIFINFYSSVTEIYMNIAKIRINVQCKEQLMS
jgi:hypothetical protein